MPVHVNVDKTAHRDTIRLFVSLTSIDETVVYYCGKIDGVHEWENDLIVAENKTASRLSDSWRMPFAISHQVTGYIVAASEIFQHDIYKQS